ncbi:hypothetical protein GWI33_004028, partial [Rhynchophorus ferrugineus]
MDLSKLNADNIKKLTNSEIDRILLTIFTMAAWTAMSPIERAHHRNIFTIYFKKPEIRRQYTLREFLTIRRDIFALHPKGQTPPISDTSSSSSAPSSNPSNVTLTSQVSLEGPSGSVRGMGEGEGPLLLEDNSSISPINSDERFDEMQFQTSPTSSEEGFHGREETEGVGSMSEPRETNLCGDSIPEQVTDKATVQATTTTDNAGEQPETEPQPGISQSFSPSAALNTLKIFFSEKLSSMSSGLSLFQPIFSSPATSPSRTESATSDSAADTSRKTATEATDEKKEMEPTPDTDAASAPSEGTISSVPSTSAAGATSEDTTSPGASSPTRSISPMNVLCQSSSSDDDCLPPKEK